VRLSIPSARHVAAAIAIAVVVGWLATPAPRAQGTGQSFATLQPGFTQELCGVTGEFVFGARREIDSGGEEHHSLLVVQRPDFLKPVDTPVDNSQVVRRAAMVPEPDGVAFHAATGLVVTLNESPDCNGEPRTRHDGTRV